MTTMAVWYTDGRGVGTPNHLTNSILIGGIPKMRKKACVLILLFVGGMLCIGCDRDADQNQYAITIYNPSSWRIELKDGEVFVSEDETVAYLIGDCIVYGTSAAEGVRALVKVRNGALNSGDIP